MALFDPVHDRLERFARALTRDRDAAREVVAETVLIAYENFESLRHPEAFLSFLFTIARRAFQKQSRKESRSEPLADAHWNAMHDPRMQPDVHADISAVYTALEELPQLQREAVILFEIIGMSMKEIQEVQGGTLVAVKVRIQRGRKRLAKILCVDERSTSSPMHLNAADGALGSYTIARES